MEHQWYIVHTYSGFEQRVKKSLEERIKSVGRDTDFSQILVPTEKVEELIKGGKKESIRKFYPGYIMVKMELNDESWHLVNDTPKVTGFLGEKNKPLPISEEEAQKIISQMEEGLRKPRPKYHFEERDEVRVIDGPFTNFNGVVDEVKPVKGKLRVLISIFGRPTPVELDFIQVSKI